MRRLILAGVLLVAPSISVAQSVCDSHEAIKEYLEGSYSEVPAFEGVLSGHDHLVEIYVNPDIRTWTVVVVAPGGRACAVMAGKALEPVAQKTPEDDT